jgi:hypothetical protein
MGRTNVDWVILHKYIYMYRDCELNSREIGQSPAAGIYVASECCGNFKIIQITSFYVEDYTLTIAFRPKLDL